MSALLHGILSARISGGVGAVLLTARRYSDGGTTQLAVFSSLATDATYAAMYQQIGTLSTTGATTALNTAVDYGGGYMAGASAVAWSERVPRSLPPVLTFVAFQPTIEATALVVPNANAAQPSTINTVYGAVSPGATRALTRNGLIVVNAAGPTSLLINLYTCSGPALFSPPLLAFESSNMNCSDVALYETPGPFYAVTPLTPNLTVMDIQAAEVSQNPNPGAYVIRQDGSVSVLFSKNTPGESLYVGRYFSPSQSGPAEASALGWNYYPGPYTYGRLIVPDTAGADYLPGNLAMCNDGGTVITTVYQESSIQLRYWSASNVIVSVSSTSAIFQTLYGSGAMLAFGPSKIAWFDIGPLTNFRVVDCTVAAAPTVTDDVATNMAAGARFIKYMGFSSSDAMYVAVVYDTTVNVYSCAYAAPLIGWSLEGTYFGLNVNQIQTLTVDTIEADGSALLVAFTDDPDVTLYQEVLLV